ncbi:hypothetical protein PC41400_16680 [Paenibacillus chitinolyticus]|uniref:Uncharacterized protein n=1 Tax=Paenibacillus chitinolyticus TaxID=79263 RepID=A0A410WY35_9BACL|nr:hypothetical protein [Paenibacillus chitinolyticus]MCY9589853.1 hypothetical protein [Paenibacillus chitinolyticus]MCY9598146.1 hypothetical protein [Paenibacillus chitinolyticus]QAV19227.1 hypothetical protein PC41400_16680 [Paenibacillus chitinolyticus]
MFSGGQEDKFAAFGRQLLESVRQAVNEAFLRDHTGKIIGLGEQLRNYFKTNDEQLLYGIVNDIVQEINAVFRFSPSDEACTTLAYGVNVYQLTLRGLAGYKESYYSVADTYAIRLAEFSAGFINPIKESMQAEPVDVIFISKKSESICTVKEDPFGRESSESGAEYSFSLSFKNTMAVPHILGFAHSYNAYTTCVPYPKGSFGHYNFNWKPDRNFFKTTEEYKQTEAFRKRVYDARQEQAGSSSNLWIERSRSGKKPRFLFDPISL